MTNLCLVLPNPQKQAGGQMKTQARASLGPLLQQEAARTNRFPCSLSEGELVPHVGLGVSWRELRGVPTPVEVLGAGARAIPALAPSTLVTEGFWPF